MLQHLVRRVLLAFVTLLLITFFVFGLIRAMPGDPLLVQMAEMNPDRKVDPEEIERLREQQGLNDPVPVAYVKWLGKIVQGDLGESMSRPGAKVASLIGERIPATLLLTVTSLILTYLLAIPMGLLATVRSGRLDERVMSTGLYMLYSLPAFVGALFLQILFALKLEGTAFELPLNGMVTTEKYDDSSTLGKAWDIFQHAILPVTCFTYASLAYYSRFIKSNMNEVIRQDYIRTARAKGVRPLNIVVHHAFRNTLIPLVTLFGLTLPTLLSGAVILEQIFTWPGMGNLFFVSLLERDHWTLMGLVLIFSVLTLVGQLLADVLYTFVDPRVSFS